MSNPLSFTPNFTYTQQDAGSTLKIVIDYSDFPDFEDFSSLSVNISTENTNIDADIDLTSSIISNLTGTVTASVGDSTLTGTLSSFEDELSAGDYITFGDDTDRIYLIHAVTSDTEIVLYSPLVADLAGSTMKKYAKAVYLQVDDLGISTSTTFSDDLYTFLYTFTFTGTTNAVGTYVETKALSCVTNCAIQALIANIPSQLACSPCNSDYIDQTMEAFLHYEALKGSSHNGTIDIYNSIYSGLSDIIDLIATDCSA